MLQSNEKDVNKSEENEESLAKVFTSFHRFQQKLWNIFKDTFKLIKSEPYLNSRDTSFLKEEKTTNFLKNPISILIFGDSYLQQCQCLNNFLGSEIVPIISPSWLAKKSKITVRYGAKTQLNLILPSNFILPVTQTYIADQDLNVLLSQYATLCQDINATSDCYFMDINVKELENSSVEILLNKSFLKDNVKIIVNNFDETITDDEPSTSTQTHSSITPIIFYALKDINIDKLKQVKSTYGELPVLFWLTEHYSTDKTDFAKCNFVADTVKPYFTTLKHGAPQKTLTRYQNIDSADIKPVSNPEPLNCVTNHITVTKIQCEKNISKRSVISITELKTKLISAGFKFGNQHDSSTVKCDCSVLFGHKGSSWNDIISFVESALKFCLLEPATLIRNFHRAALDEMVNRVFTLSRDVMLTPKKVEYAREKEAALYRRLMEVATHEQDEIANVIGMVKRECKSTIVELARNFQLNLNDTEVVGFTEVASVTNNIQDLVLQHIKVCAADRLTGNIDVLRENMTGTLQRCLESLENTTEFHGNTDEEASTHLKLIINAAYNVDVNIKSSSSLLKIVMDKIIGLLQQLSWKELPILDEGWKVKVANDVLTNICEEKLAKNICSQFRFHLNNSHKAFLCALRHLESHHSERVKREKEDNHRTAKVLAPHIAQLTLRSKSYIDELVYGVPKLGREIGRGMYGVVFACSDWPISATRGHPCAVKSVVPYDEKHWNDLALEFYYSSCLPPHPRIVQLHGSVVDDAYSDDQSAVLLIMERLQRDLHSALKRGMYEHHRMLIALDVVEGIRFLHSQGLVHRDIKLKNILLDEHNRAKISDLGFCKPSAMISGSIVGTPVHMPPELFTGKYDNSVDVYAFGILFWHLCSGSIKLPKNYKKCSTKDHLWNAVRNGTRPECLSVFRSDCWVMMSRCWDANPSNRPLLGNIEETLRHIIEEVVKGNGLCA